MSQSIFASAHPFEVLSVDDSVLDVVIRTADGVLLEPWMFVVINKSSRVPLCHHVSFDGPSLEEVVRRVSDSMARHSAVPRLCHHRPRA